MYANNWDNSLPLRVIILTTSILKKKTIQHDKLVCYISRRLYKPFERIYLFFCVSLSLGTSFRQAKEYCHLIPSAAIFHCSYYQ